MKLHLPKKLLAAVMALFAMGVNTTMGDDVISINFASGQRSVNSGSGGTLNGAKASTWNNVNTEATNQNLKGSSGSVYSGALTLVHTSGTWNSGVADVDTLVSDMQYGYLDLPNHSGGSTWTVTLDFTKADIVANPLYYSADLVVYFAGDGGKYGTISVGNDADPTKNNYYKGGKDQVVSADTAWGDRSKDASANVGADINNINTNNTVVVTDVDLSKELLIQNYLSTTNRATTSGMQLIITDLYNEAKLNAGNNDAESVVWTAPDAVTGTYKDFKDAASRFGADVSAGNAVLSFEAGANIGILHAEGGNELTIDADGDIAIGRLDVAKDTTMSMGNLFADTATLIKTGDGLLTLTESQDLAAVEGSGLLHLSDGVKVNVGAINFDGAVTGGADAALNISMAVGSSSTVNGITVTNEKGQVSMNALAEGKTDVTAADGSIIGISSAGGVLLVNGTVGSKVELSSLELTENNKTTLSVVDGVTVSGEFDSLVIDGVGKELVVGKGISLKYTAEDKAVNIGNGTLTIDGGEVVTSSIVTANLANDKSSYINITNGGKLEITGSVDPTQNNGSIFLGHWKGKTTTIKVSDGEFLAQNAITNMGWDSYDTRIEVGEKGILNLKGMLRLAERAFRPEINVDIAAGGIMNLGEAGIAVMTASDATTANYTVSGTIGALSEKGWSSDKDITLNDGAIVQLAVWDVENKQYTDKAADIDLTAGVGGSGKLTLAGSGKLIVSSALAHDVSSTGGKLALTDLANLECLGTGDTYSGYGDSTTDGYTSAQYRIAGAGSTITEAILIKDTETETTYTVSGGVMTVNDGMAFVVNTEVDRAKITEWKDGTALVLGSGSAYHTSVLEDLGAIGSVADDTAAVYLQNADGKDLLKITNVPVGTALNATIGGDNNTEILCSDGSYTGNFTVLTGTTLKQSNNDYAGEGYDLATERTITVQNGAKFDINGHEAYYHIILEKGATLANSGTGVGNGGRNLALVELGGDATVDTATRLGVVFSQYNASELHLNGNTLTKTGVGTFHLNNCTTDAGKILIKEGEVELMEYQGPLKTDVSATTFEIGTTTVTGEDGNEIISQGGIYYNEGSTAIHIGHLIASGGYVRVTGDRELVVDKLTGSSLTKMGSAKLTLAEGIKIADDIKIEVDAGTLALSTVEVADGKTLTVTGTATADKVVKTGSGSLTIAALSANTVQMSSGMTIATLNGGAQIAYTDIASVGSITALAGDTIIDLFGVSDAVADGINLGIAYTEDNLSKLQLFALEDMVDSDGNATWELVDDNGFIRLQGIGDAKITLHTDWDINWGGRGLLGAPVGELPVASITANKSLYDDANYNKDGVVSVSLGANGLSQDTLIMGNVDTPGVCVVGGKFFGDKGNGEDVVADVWIHADGGAYGAIVGGNMAGNWGGSTKNSSFVGNTHILIDDRVTDAAAGKTANDLYVVSVMGGNFADPSGEDTAAFTGNTYVSVYTDSVAGGLIGASTMFHNGYATYTGDSHVYVYAPLTSEFVVGNNNTSVPVQYRNEGDMVVGGGFVARGNYTHTGSASLMVDLSEYTGSQETFDKKIIGGMAVNHLAGGAFDPVVTQRDGVIKLTVKGGKKNGEKVVPVTFTDQIVGGTYTSGKVTCTISDVEMSLSDAACTEWVAGGAFLNSSNTTLNLGAVKLTLTDASFDKLTVGGVFVGGHSSSITGGNIDITIDGAEFKDKFYGSVYHFNSQYGSTSRIGDVCISLVGDGKVSGAIYAAGGASGSAANIYVNSTKITIKDTVQLEAGSIISAGFNVPEGNYRNVSVTGDRTIMFTGEKSQDRTGILFSSFNKIGVETAGTTATIGGADITITDALTVIGEGTLKLAANTGLNATQGITIEKDATVALNGNAATGDVLVNGGVDIVGGGSLNGSLTLAAGSSLTLWDGTEAGANGLLDMSVPTVEGAALLSEGNALTIGGLFGLNVKVNPDGEVELVTGIGSLTGIEFDDENKVLANTVLSDINGKDVDGKLYLVYEDGTLKLSAIAGMTDFYWEDTDTTTEKWTEKLWSVKDNNGDNLVNIKDAATRADEVNAIFNNGKAETVHVDTAATVDDLTVSGADSVYTFSQAENTEGSLTIEGKLTVTDSATATFNGALANVGAAELEVSDGGTLNAGAVTITGAATVDGGTLGVTSLGADSLTASNGATVTATTDIEIAGKAEITGSTVNAGKVTITGAASVNGGTLSVTSLGADSLTASNGATVTATTDIEIAGKAEISGSIVDAAGLLSAAEVVISGDTANVEADRIKVGEGGLSMSGGKLNSGQLFSSDEVTAKAEITGGTVTIGGSTLSSTTVTGAEFVGNSTLAGAADKAVTVGNITVDGAGSKLTLSDATLTDKITVEDGGTLEFGGTMHLDTTASDFGMVNNSTYYAKADAERGELIADGGNGFVSRNEVYTVVEGSLTNVDPQGSSWTVGEDKRVGSYADGKVTVSESMDTTAYWVNTNVTLSNVSGNFVEDTATIKLNGGTLQMNEATDLAIETNNENPHGTASTIALQSGASLKSEQLTIADGTTVTLTGLAKTTFDLGSDAGVDSTKLLGLDKDTWAGTVTTAATDITNVAALGNAASEVELTGAVDSGVIALGDVGKVHATDSLTAESISGTGALKVDGLTTLKKGTSSLSNAAFDGGLVLGGDEAAALTGTDLTVTAASVELANGSSVDAKTLTVGAGITMGKDSKIVVETLEANGAIILEAGSSIKSGSLTLGEEASIGFKKIGEDPVVSVDSLTADTLQVLIDNKLMADAADAQTDKTQPIATIMEVTEPSANMPEITLNGGSKVINPKGEKYGYTLDWNDTLLQLMATANQNYMKEKFSEGSANAKAGATIMDEAFASGATNADGDLKKILAAVDNGAMTEEGLASVAGSSTAALGMAFAGDVDRQLRAIRNRTTTMGVNQCVVNEGMPYFNAWVNAEGNLGELDKDGTFAGYQLDSWGGTIGFDVDVNPHLTLGLAVTAMYGDLTVDGPDKLDGDLDTMYVSAFARYSARAWTHTFVGTVGMMDSSYKRTVSYGQGESYKTEGDTDGMAFGLMYEVGRVIALTESGSACLQPVFNVAYRHTTAGGYTEKGGDAALKVDDQTLDTVTLGAGARLQAVVGENLYNRTSLLELRALAKVDLGDRASEADVAFIGGAGKATVESAELGAFGVELGAGLSVPMGDEDSGTLFFDVSAELRSGYTNLNGTVGYRINF